MTSVLDVWRWVDSAARLASGSVDRLQRPVRGVRRTRATPPHLPPLADGQLLVVDATVIDDGGLDTLVVAIAAAGLDPAAIWVGAAGDRRFEHAGADVPIVVGELAGADIERRVARHLDDERQELQEFTSALRLAAAEAALADPQPSAPAAIVAARLRRGVAVSVDGSLSALNPRPAGRALATRFAAAHAHVLVNRSAPASSRRTARDGLWVMERSVGTAATAWLFDDLPFAAVDEMALGALVVTLHALLRRPSGRPRPASDLRRLPPSSGDPLRDTLVAVARSNGRIAPAARSLGVHRNTVLYRLRRASAELGVDPRRPEDALRLLREADRGRGEIG